MVPHVEDSPRARNGWSAGHTVILCLLCVITALGIWRWCHTGNANSAALVAPLGALELLRRRHVARGAAAPPIATQTPPGLAKPSQHRPLAFVLRVLAVVLLAAGLVFGITATVSHTAAMDHYAATDNEVGVTTTGIELVQDLALSAVACISGVVAWFLVPRGSSGPHTGGRA